MLRNQARGGSGRPSNWGGAEALRGSDGKIFILGLINGSVMPHECEVCGSAKAGIKASFDSVVLNVCQACSGAGKIIEQPNKPVLARQPILAYQAPESGETITPDFGKIISKARQQLGLKQDELALQVREKLPVSQAAEQGKRLDLTLAKKLEKFLKIKVIETI